MKPHVVKQGEYLSKLAHGMGFDAAKVWDAPENAELKKLRACPEVLLPGDVLFVPDRPPPRRLSIEAGTTNRIVAKVPEVLVHLRLQSEDPKVVYAGKPCVVEGLGAPLERRVGPDGALSLSVPLHVREVRVLFPHLRRSFRVAVGGLDPATETSGIRMRLAHLGFRFHGDGAAALADAVRAFQKAHRLPLTGEVDDATREALVLAHGS